MELSDAKIVIKSEINSNCYYLFNDKIIVDKNNNYIDIYLPKKSGVVCFYDMYYASDGLRIIMATRNDYDLVGILNEYNLMLDITKFTK